MASLQRLLQETPVDEITRQEIINSIWPMKTPKGARPKDLDWHPYFSYYVKQCHHALHGQGKHVLVRTHQHVVDIIHLLEEGIPKDLIKPHLKSLFHTPNPAREEEIIYNSIDLAARLNLMINIGASKYAISGQSQLIWNDGSLGEHVRAFFNEPQVLGNSIKMEHTFTPCNIERIAGIKIRWTDNLVDHLRIVDDKDRIVAVFHHASFVKRNSGQILPPGLQEETLHTFALLFPQHDRQTIKWFQHLPEANRIDQMISKCGHLRLDDRQIETFHFWHDRLIVLKQAYDQSKPATLLQWWHDLRNGERWYTFWVAVVVLFLTIFFGIVQSLEGALQVYKAYHPSNSL